MTQLREIGPADALKCLLKKARYRMLARRFGFDPWHAKSPFECRLYKREVVRLANQLAPQASIEIGCGLGEIVSRVAGGHRFGFDVDASVIAAARFLHGDRCRFETAGLAEIDAIRGSIDASIGMDVMILVNWPHALAWSEFSSHVESLASALSLRYLIMDTIPAGTPGYLHHHSLRDLGGLGSIVESISSRDNVRALHVVDLARR